MCLSFLSVCIYLCKSSMVSTLFTAETADTAVRLLPTPVKRCNSRVLPDSWKVKQRSKNRLFVCMKGAVCSFEQLPRRITYLACEIPPLIRSTQILQHLIKHLCYNYEHAIV